MNTYKIKDIRFIEKFENNIPFVQTFESELPKEMFLICKLPKMYSIRKLGKLDITFRESFLDAVDWCQKEWNKDLSTMYLNELGDNLYTIKKINWELNASRDCYYPNPGSDLSISVASDRYTVTRNFGEGEPFFQETYDTLEEAKLVGENLIHKYLHLFLEPVE